MKANDPKEWMREYSEFLGSKEVPVPRDLNERVVGSIHALLNPSAWMVFGKLLGIHIVVGFLSLGICHQFDMNPFGTQSSLSDWFMGMWGHSACMIACGTIFVSFSILTAGILMTGEEIRVLKRTEFLQTLSLGAFSLVAFFLLGAQIALTFAGLWLLGVLIGGFIATEATAKLKLRYI
jgi:hypothetical protein